MIPEVIDFVNKNVPFQPSHYIKVVLSENGIDLYRTV